MKIKLIYFSGTGNTLFISELMKSSFMEKGAASVEFVEVSSISDNLINSIDDNTLIGFAYPVYDYKPAENILKLAKRIKFELKRPCFVFGTYTTNPLDSNMHLIKILKVNNLYTIEEGYFKAPGASAFFYSNPNFTLVRPLTKFEPNLEKSISKFVDNILSKYSNFYQNPKHVDIKFNRLNKFHQWFSNQTFGNIFYRNLKVNDNCSSCGVCVINCPDKNLKLSDNIVEISKKNNCLRCLKCIQLCKKRAINFTSQKRKGDYTTEILKECYSKS